MKIKHATEQPMGHRKKFKKYLEINKNGNIMYQNLWDTAKAILRDMFIAINAYIKTKDFTQKNELFISKN